MADDICRLIFSDLLSYDWKTFYNSLTELIVCVCVCVCVCGGGVAATIWWWNITLFVQHRRIIPIMIVCRIKSFYYTWFSMFSFLVGKYTLNLDLDWQCFGPLNHRSIVRYHIGDHDGPTSRCFQSFLPCREVFYRPLMTTSSECWGLGVHLHQLRNAYQIQNIFMTKLYSLYLFHFYLLNMFVFV